MAIRTLTKSGINNTNVSSKAFPAGFAPVTEPWVRNPSWPAISAEVGDNRAQGLHAVFPGDGVGNGGNFVAMQVNGAYTIDFGDGTVTNYSANSNAYYEYDYNNAALDGTNAPVTLTDSGDLVTRTAHGYSDGMVVNFYNITTTTGIEEAQQYYVINSTANTFQISATEGGSAIALTNDGSATLLPYKIAVVTITPQAGQNITSAYFSTKHNQSGLVNGYSSGWLDVAVALPNCTNFNFAVSSSTAPRHSQIEKFTINELNDTSLDFLFYNCYSLREFELNSSFASSVTNMSSMFNGCYSLTSVPLFDTSSVTEMASTFSNCYSLKTVPLFDTSNVTTMSGMFYFNYSLESIPLLDTSNVTTMTNMFVNCYSLTSIPLFDTSNVTSMNATFTSCYSLTSIPLFDTSNVTNMSGVFTNCVSLTSIPLFDTSNVTNMTSRFQNCYSLTSIPLFDTSNVTSMNNMFQNCVSLESIPLLDTSNATNMSYMFYNCYSLKSVPLFNTSSVTNMSNMFFNCPSLESIPLFNTSNVTRVDYMFYRCYSLESIPLLNTSNVTNMNNMFRDCFSLKTVPAFDVSAVTSATNLNLVFSACSSLSRIEATGFKYTFAVSSCKLSSAALDEIYTNLPTVTGQTITVTGNYGTSGDDPTIATAKGWTVTG